MSATQITGTGMQIRGEGKTITKEMGLSIALDGARAEWQRVKKTNTADFIIAEYEAKYTEALKQYSQHIAETRGAEAVEQFAFGETWKFGKIWREKNKKLVLALGAGAVLAAISLGVGIFATGVITTAAALELFVAAKAVNIALGFVISTITGLSVRKLTEMRLRKRVANKQELDPTLLTTKRYKEAVEKSKEFFKNGGTYADFEKTEDGKVIRAWTRLSIFKNRAGVIAGLAMAGASITEFGQSVSGTVIEKMTGSYHTFETMFIDAKDFHFAKATLGSVFSNSLLVPQFLLGLASPSNALAEALPDHAPKTGVPDFHHPDEGKPVHPISKLGGDSYIPGETLAERTEFFIRNYDRLVLRAADELAREGAWSPEQKAGFIKTFMDPANKPKIIAMFKGDMESGTIKQGSLIYAMMNGEKPEGGINEARGPYKYTGADTPAVLVEYGWIDAQGHEHVGLAAIPRDCGNISDLGPVEVPPVPPAENTCAPWRATILETKGIAFSDGFGETQVFKNIIEIHAPGTETMQQATDDLAAKIESGELKIKNGARFLISIDRDCDKVPEEIDCATVKIDSDGHVTICHSPLKVSLSESKFGQSHQKPYKDLDAPKRKDWYTR